MWELSRVIVILILWYKQTSKHKLPKIRGQRQRLLASASLLNTIYIQYTKVYATNGSTSWLNCLLQISGELKNVLFGKRREITERTSVPLNCPYTWFRACTNGLYALVKLRHIMRSDRETFAAFRMLPSDKLTYIQTYNTIAICPLTT